MSAHDFLVVFIGLIAEIIGTVSGFGSSTYFVPLALFFEKFTFVITLTAFLHTFSNLFKVYFFGQHFDKKLFLRMAVPSITFCGIGALIVPSVDLKYIKVVLGCFLIFFSFVAWIRIARPLQLKNGSIIFLSSLSGFFTGLVGTGGALRGLTLSALNISKESFVFLSSSVDFGGDFLRLILYLKNGYMQWDQWFYIPLLILAAMAGTYIGKKILKRIQQKTFERIVLVFTLFSGVLLIFNSLK